MRHARGKEAQADEAVLFFDAAEGGCEFVFAFTKRLDGVVARAHDLADLVAHDFGFGDQLGFAVAGLGG